MWKQSVDQSSIYANRRFSRRHLDVRASVVAQRSTGEQITVQARTFDLSRTGAGLTLTCDLPSGIEVMLNLQIPEFDGEFCLRAVITRRKGCRAGLCFVQPTTRQRFMLSELCDA